MGRKELNKKRNETSKSVRVSIETWEDVTKDCDKTGVPIGRFFDNGAKLLLAKNKRKTA